MAAQIRPRLAAMPRPSWQMIGTAGPPSAMVKQVAIVSHGDRRHGQVVTRRNPPGRDDD